MQNKMDQVTKLTMKALLMREPIKAGNEQSIELKADELDEVLKDNRNIVIDVREEGMTIRFLTKEENKIAELEQKKAIIKKLFNI